MRKTNERNTRGKIINAAWKLFYEQGYDDTTIEDIVFESGTSKGSFYHYFSGKDALLSTLSFLFDERYEILANQNTEADALTRLLQLNHEIFLFIENTVPIDLLSRLLSSQLVTKDKKHLLDENRTYYKLIRRVIADGVERGELRSDLSVNELVKSFALLERSMMYDWCLCEGHYSLCAYSEKMLPEFLAFYKK
ncbi:MAG: TetR/AcrR family transcriptional regulator [Clostridia bacterium]|nr:TetR/AcrR family transcriptional regulator [Clostridia bacterium]